MLQPKDISSLMALAQSDAGQRLLALLQKNGGDALAGAVAQARNGEYTQAEKTLSVLLQDPEVKKLLQQLGEGL